MIKGITTTGLRPHTQGRGGSMAKARNLFTDIEAAMEEAYFLKEYDNGETYALVDIGAGEVWVTRKRYALKMNREIMWDTAKNCVRVLVDRRFWTAEHRALVTKLYGKLGPQVLADKTGRTKNSVVKMAQKLGVKYKGRSEIERAIIVRNREYSQHQTSRRVGMV